MIFRRVRSLSSILSSMSKTVDDLNRLEASNKQKVESNQLVVEALEARNRDLTAESTQAAKVRSNIEKLIS